MGWTAVFDAQLRPLIDPALNRLGAALARRGITADQLTLSGAAVGVMAGAVVGLGHPMAGLALIVANRTLDGLDGAVARASRVSDFGGYLDIVCDYFFYVAVPLGFGFARPENLAWAMVLIASFTLTGASFLAYAALAAKRGLETQAHGRKSLFYSTGLAEGVETMVAFVLMCLFPAWFPTIAAVFAVLCGLTVVQRSLIARRDFRDPP
jgi:phosphatidylglycerophosphate synthase